ncbi:MAG: nucleoside hydrolase [Candidatus Aenigmarchaeota archaeon]|nr:nucleoside hydrolase [Candidatus Aenigmarchaeota archaeon]
MNERLIVLTDVFNDVDDAVALYALVRSGADLAGVVTTYGNERVKAKAASKFFKMAGRPDIQVRYSKVYKTRFSAPNDMRETDYGFLTDDELIAGDTVLGANPRGEGLMENLINSSTDRISVLSLAPLSALAGAMNHVKTQRVGSIYVMGGHVGNYDNGPKVPYDRALTPEYNFACDPAAARKVLESGAKISLVGKNLWSKNLFTLKDFEFLSTGTQAQRELSRMIRLRHAHNKKSLEPLGIGVELFMYDPIATCAVLFPELYDFERIEMVVDENGVTHTKPAKEGNVYGAVNADLPEIKSRLMGLILG